MTQLLFTILVIAICPLMMFFMMRGMRGGGRRDDTQMQNPALPMRGFTQDARIADLEAEVARLNKARPDDVSLHSIVAARDQAHPEASEAGGA